MNVEGKKLMVLGGSGLSHEIVKCAKDKGVFVLVADYDEDSIGKRLADKQLNIDIKDVERIVESIEIEGIDGVITGFTDSILNYYRQICEKANLPAYIDKEQVGIATNKYIFKQICHEFDIETVKEYGNSETGNIRYSDPFEFPLLVKPVDNSGGRGIFICERSENLRKTITESAAFSKSGKVIIERFMGEEEITAFYIIRDGEVCLSAVADRILKHPYKDRICLPSAYVFPSKHLDAYISKMNRNAVKMIKSIGALNGMIFIQSFVENGRFVFYEMGYRLTASMEYKIIGKLCGYSALEMMVDFALTGLMHDGPLSKFVKPDFNKFGCNLTLLIEPGEIGEIIGIDRVMAIPEVIDVVESYAAGEVVPESDRGTLGQVAVRIFAVCETREELNELAERVSGIIRIISKEGKNMVLNSNFF